MATLSPLPGLQPLKTHHCVTGSMRHLYQFHGYPISEELLLGLGAGVGFVYWHMKDTLPFYGGRANVGRPGEEGLEKTAGRRTGVTVESFHTGSPRAAEKSLLEMLAAGEPVMIQVDMAYLPYLNLPEDYHFGGHVVVVAGCDPEGRQALVADRDGELHPVSLEALARARGSQFKPFPPCHTWYRFDFARKRPPGPEEVRQAIREVAAAMLKPPISNLGVKGIRTAAERTAKWAEVLDEGQLRAACFNIFIFVDATGGTGGGLFRYMYGRFLEEAAAIVGDPRLAEVGTEMRILGDRWQEVALLLREGPAAPTPAALLPEAARLLRSIAGLEQAAWGKLAEIAG